MTAGGWLVAPRSDAPHRRSPTITVTVTSCTDDRAHEVLDVEIAAAADRANGVVQAVCGQMITAAPMVAPEGRSCPLCALTLDSRAHQRGRRQWKRLWRGLW